MTGFSIGKGKVAARLYDKPLEISQKSKKVWMYEIWTLPAVPEGFRIIRVEGQFRREGIKELGVDSAADLFGSLDHLWAYFTRSWLKFQDRPGQHPLTRKHLPFWRTIQNGFLGVQNACPLIRCQSLQTKKKQLAAQAYGLISSFGAIEQEEQGVVLGADVAVQEVLSDLADFFEQEGKCDFGASVDVLEKRGKFNKVKAKMAATRRQRSVLGLPCNLPNE